MTTKKTPTNYEIVKSLFPSTPPDWDSRINLGSQAAWDSAKTLISSDNFSATRNQIFNAIMNKIALTKIKDVNFSNPLAMFKSGVLSVGDTIEEISTDIIAGNQYKKGNAPQFDTNDPDVRAVYHKVNRQDFYKITVYDVQLQYAFTTTTGLANLIRSIISQLEKSNIVDEYIYTKKLLTSTINNSEVPLKPTQILDVPNLRKRTRTQEDIRFFIEDVKKVLRSAQFPNRKYNAAGQMQQTSASDLVLILNSDVLSINETQNLALTFRPEFHDLNVPIVSVDEIDDRNPDIVGAIMSRNAMNIHDTKTAMTQAVNAEALYTNYFLHVHQIYSASPFETLIYIKEGV